MKRAELAFQLDLALGIQPKVQERATHHQEEHVLTFDGSNTSLIERFQREDNDCQDRESRRQRPRHHVYRQFVYKGRFFSFHSYTDFLTAETDNVLPVTDAFSYLRLQKTTSRHRSDLCHLSPEPLEDPTFLGRMFGGEADSVMSTRRGSRRLPSMKIVR